MPRTSTALPLALIASLLLPAASVAQKPPPKPKAAPVATTLPEILATFLADSGVATRGLPWTTGNSLPVTWNSTGPVPTQMTFYPGITSERTGTARMTTSDTGTVEVQLYVLGNSAGVQRFWVNWDMTALRGETADSLLAAAGFTLTPTKCSRETEGYSFGNLQFIIKAPGKKAAGLQEGWNCAQETCLLAYSLFYRKADVEQIDCAGS